MATLRTFESSFILAITEGREHEFALTVEYNFERGYPDTYDEPGCDDGIEIVRVRLFGAGGKEVAIPAWIEQVILADDCLTASILTEAREQHTDNRNYAAECRAEIAREYAEARI